MEAPHFRNERRGPHTHQSAALQERTGRLNSADSRSGWVTYSWLGKVRLRLGINYCPNYLFTKIFPKASSNIPEYTKLEYCIFFSSTATQKPIYEHYLKFLNMSKI